MNVKRYTIAGSISFAIHAAFVFVAQEPKAFAMPAGAQSSSVSINFKAPASAASAPPPVTSPEQQTEPDPVKKEVAPAPIKKASKQPAPIKKKIVKKEPTTKKKVTKNQPKSKSTPVVKPPKDKPVEKIVEEQNKPEQQVSETQPELVNQGASAQPVMVTKPSFLTRPSAPKYPRLARKRGVEGVALYEVWLDEKGRQVKQVLISSSGAHMLDKSALDAIKKWQFSPHSVDGQKIAHRVQIPVRFKLD